MQTSTSLPKGAGMSTGIAFSTLLLNLVKSNGGNESILGQKQVVFYAFVGGKPSCEGLSQEAPCKDMQG
jgi:hypothetical protein